MSVDLAAVRVVKAGDLADQAEVKAAREDNVAVNEWVLRAVQCFS